MSSRRRRETSKRLFVTVLAVLMGSGALLAWPGGDGVIAEIRTLVKAYIRDDISPGLVVGLRFGETTWIEAFGISDIKTSDLLTSEHQFFVGSIAKQFTAAAVLRLIEEGRACLDASITSYLPDAPETWS
ncbi:serine hydrolase, partial [Candidatus Bipolaricaulota bacterium]